VEQDEKEGLRLINEAMAVSSVEAYNYLGYMYMEGVGVLVDYAKANEYFNEAVRRGYLGAGISLAQMYFNGWGSPKNPTKALRAITYCAEKGHTTAIAYLGMMYRDGFGVTKSSDKAFENLKTSALAGDTLGLYAYAKFLLDHRPPEGTDWEVIANFYLKATEKRNKEIEQFDSFYVDALHRIFAGLE